MKGKAVLENLKNSINQDFHTCLIGVVESYDSKNMSCDVQPMNSKLPKLINVPVSFTNGGGFFIRTPYKKGDMVVIVFADEDIDNILLGEANTPNTDRRHDLSDGIIVGGLTTFNNNLPTDYDNYLLISNKSGTGSIAIKENGEIEINTTKLKINRSE